MTITTSIAVKNQRLFAISNAWGAKDSALLQIYAGPPPLDCDKPLHSNGGGNILLVQVTPTPYPAANGSKNMIGPAHSNIAVASGAPTFYRVYDTAGVCHEQGTVGTSGADLILDQSPIGIGQAVTVSTWIKTEP